MDCAGTYAAHPESGFLIVECVQTEAICFELILVIDLFTANSATKSIDRETR